MPGVINPFVYASQGHDAVQQFKDEYGRKPSSKMQDWFAQLLSMNAQFDLEDAWFTKHESASARFQDMIDAGFNPLNAGRAILGNPNYSNDVGSAPSLPSTDADYMNATANMLGTAQQGVQAAVQASQNAQMVDAQTANLRSDTAKNIATLPTIAPESESRQVKNLAEAGEAVAGSEEKRANVGVLNARQQEIIQNTAVLKENERLVKAQADQYVEYSNAQIQAWRSEAILNYQKAKTEQHMQKEIDANALYLGAQTDVAKQQKEVLVQEEAGKAEEVAQQRIVTDFMAKTGCPLDADIVDKISYYESVGRYDDAEDLLIGTFDVHLAASTSSSGSSIKIGEFEWSGSESNPNHYRSAYTKSHKRVSFENQNLKNP